ncbi:phosphoglycerate mutase-like protein [Russula emetica]|nr:phosphoglycerate mutase-like protein [Russula emetica]
MRHHKRAPVVLVPNELEINDGIKWDCTDVRRFTYYGGGTGLYHTVYTPPNHPFAPRFWAGSCEEGQLTAGGFSNSELHGKDLWELYHSHLGFLRSVNPDEINVRTTYVDRTKNVASGVLAGMDPSTAGRPWPVHAQPHLIDSLGPSYKCPRADYLAGEGLAAPVWQEVWKNNSALHERIDSVLGTTSYVFSFYQDIVTARVCNDHPLPCNAAGDCISEEDAAQIFELANLEANYLWNAAEYATEYNQLTFGVMFSELADALQKPTHRLALYVAHDTSIVRIAAGLGIVPLRWPRLGSEFVFEIWRDKNGDQFVRVFYDGELISSLSWTPIDTFICHLRQQVPKDLFEKCSSESVAGEAEKGKLPQFFVQ